MAKFKIGDRVRVVKGLHSGAKRIVVGVLDTGGKSQIYEISTPDIVYVIACFIEDWLELAGANAYPMPGLDFEREPARYPCRCDMREFLMRATPAGGY